MPKIHFIAIGGSAMHNLAIALQEKGYTVSGSDDHISEPSKSRLAEKNLLPAQTGWFPEKITEDLDGIILGKHAHSDNPELEKAQKLGLKIYSYPEFLFETSKDKTRVVIAGSHGKTTITSIVLHVLKFHGKEADFMSGAKIEDFDCMVNLSENNDFMILEGDEYPSSALDSESKFLHYQPNIALLSGISWDHINVFPTFESYLETFRKFVASITPGGILVYNSEDENVVQLVESAENYFRKISYQTPDFNIQNETTYLRTEIGNIPLLIFGEHNLQNIEGARHICQQLGILEEEFYDAIMSFKGADSRLEAIKRNDNAIVYRDFAHSPSKVKAAANAFAKKFPSIPAIGILELHTYSSLTPEFLELYKNTLNPFSEAVIFYSEDALKLKRMTPLSEELIKKAFDHPSLKIFSDTESFHRFWKEKDKSNAAFLLMSSGNFDHLDFGD